MITDRPVVTVLITVFNGESHIASALDSLLVQRDAPNFEILVIDDGSTDGTAAILERYAPRVRTEHIARLGRGGALALGVEMARGDFVAILDADDLAAPDRVIRQASFLNQNPRVAWVGCAERRIDTRRQEDRIRTYPTKNADIRRMAARCIPYSHSGVMFRRVLLDEGLNYRAEVPFLIDFDFFLRVAERHEVANLPEPLVTRHLRSQSYFEKSFSRRQQNRVLARMNLDAVHRLNLPRQDAIFPLLRLGYDLFPNRAKRVLRQWSGLGERVAG